MIVINEIIKDETLKFPQSDIKLKNEEDIMNASLWPSNIVISYSHVRTSNRRLQCWKATKKHS